MAPGAGGPARTGGGPDRTGGACNPTSKKAPHGSHGSIPGRVAPPACAWMLEDSNTAAATAAAAAEEADTDDEAGADKHAASGVSVAMENNAGSKVKPGCGA